MQRTAAIFLLVAMVSVDTAADETSGRIRFQLGHEYDTNSMRVYHPEESDNLVRAIVEGLLQHEADRHRLMLNYQGGLKLFYNQSSEDLLANRLKGTYRFTASDNWHIGGRAAFRDTVLEQHDRDYRLMIGELYARTRLLSWLDAELMAGGKYFLFKPDEYGDYSLRFSYAGPLAGLRFHLLSAREVSTTLFYQVELRFFDDQAMSFSNGQFLPTGPKRMDIRHIGGLQVRQQIRYWENRRLILELSYLVSVNDSKNAGSSAVWHRVRGLISMQMPFATLHLMGTLQFTGYPDGIYVEGDLYEPEADENENSLVIRVSIPLSDQLGLVLQGAVYRNDFNSSELDVGTFGRETVMLGLVCDLSL